MICQSCGAQVDPNATRCAACDAASSGFAAGAMYGSVSERPTRGAFVLTLAGVAALVLALAGFAYYKNADKRRADAADLAALSAEYDALADAAARVRALADAARPETPPQEYQRLTNEARAAVEGYRAKTATGGALPSARPWPGQFETAAKNLDESLKYLGVVNAYLAERAKIKSPKPGATVDADQNVMNVAATGTTALEKVETALERMREQRDAGAWDYTPAVPRRR